MAIQNPSQEKLHYDSLISLFKYVIGAFTLLAGVVVFMIGNSLNEIKKNITEEVAQSTKKLENVKSDADKTVAETKADSKEVLQYTRDLTTMQISLLKEDAKNLALSSARNKVEEAFKNNNIQTLIDLTARKEVSDKLKDVVKVETDKTREIFEYLPKIQIAVEQIGYDSYKDLCFVDSLSNYAENDMIRNYSKSLLLQKGGNFDYNYNLRSPFNDSSRRRESFLKQLDLPNLATNADAIREIISRMKSETTVVLNIARCYQYLRFFTNIDFKTLDSKPVYDWYYSNYRKN